MKNLLLIIILILGFECSGQKIKLYIFVKPEDCIKFNMYNLNLEDNKNIVFVLPSVYKNNTVEMLSKYRKAKIVYSDKLFDQNVTVGFSTFYLSVGNKVLLKNNSVYLAKYVYLVNDILKQKIGTDIIKVDSLNKIGLTGEYNQTSDNQSIFFSEIDKFIKINNRKFSYSELMDDKLLLKYFKDSNEVNNQHKLFKMPFMSSFSRSSILCALPFKKYTVLIGSTSIINTSYTPKGDTNYRMTQIFPIWFFDSIGKYQVSFLPGSESKTHSFDEGSIPFYDKTTKQLRMSFLDSNNNTVFGLLDTTLKFKF